MKRFVLVTLLIVHAFAHTSATMWTEPSTPVWLFTALSVLTFSGFFAVGLCVAGFSRWSRYWKNCIAVAITSSVILLLWNRPPFAGWGIAIDITMAFVFFYSFRQTIDAMLANDRNRPRRGPWSQRFGEIGWSAAFLVFLYCSVVVLSRSVITRWGSTASERAQSLPGDTQDQASATYRLDHAITINVPARVVWPWLMQLGQDRGGFYSYSWLERTFGIEIRNIDRIHSEWPARNTGDTVFATQASYFGGRLGSLGWRISEIEPNRVLVLDKWGSFVLQPVDSTATRLIVRTRGYGKPTALVFALGPFNTFAFEPAHFIMERAMLKGIRDRAERSVRSN